MEYGICILGLVPLRKQSNDQSEMISQILFGQHFRILEVKTNRVNIVLSSDNYNGWICVNNIKKSLMKIMKIFP